MPLYVGAQSTSTTVAAGGGGALEYVSKATPGSSVSQIDFTSLADDSVYYFIGKTVIASQAAFVKIQLMNASNSVETACVVYRRDLQSNNMSNSGSDEINTYPGAGYEEYTGFTCEVSTKAATNWVHYRGSCPQDNGSTLCVGSYDDSHTSERIGGIRFVLSGGTFESGTEIMLYKFKES